MYLTIQAIQQEKHFSIHLLCQIAEIPRSSYYKWLKRRVSPLEQKNGQLMKMMIVLYEKVEGIYGYRQLTINLRRQTGQQINYKRIYRLMRVAGIQSVIRRKKKRYVTSTPQQVAENLLNRQFSAVKSNEKWLTDVTELKYGDGHKAYLSAILDLHDKSIVAHVLSRFNDNSLVFRTLDLALEMAPGATPMIHSDRGYQYTSWGFKKRVDSHGLTQSMSRVGKCIDNGPMEGFWGTLKCEKYRLHKYQDFEALEKDIANYIHFYNHDRLQIRLNSLSPMEVRTKAA
ncbi:MAG: IS3 family transposase [bacterium]